MISLLSDSDIQATIYAMRHFWAAPGHTAHLQHAVLPHHRRPQEAARQANHRRGAGRMGETARPMQRMQRGRHGGAVQQLQGHAQAGLQQREQGAAGALCQAGPGSQDQDSTVINQ